MTPTIEDQIAAQDIAIEATRQHIHALYLAIADLWIGRPDYEKRAILEYY